uniref:Metalloendopeptidase n=1 Tax=Schmidtea mediterranea TaxID=79327 RepID=A0A060Q785_SCHMD|nr:Ast1 protein [Schmidtea mediterranea]
MQKMFLMCLAIAVIGYVSGQCGCPRQKLLKRSVDSMKMGDMLLDKSDIALINGFKNHYANTKKWPNNNVVYSFAGNFPRDKIPVVRQCLGELQRDLGNCVKFTESNQGHYIEVNSKQEGCYSLLGYAAGMPTQPLNLENPGCMYSKGTVKHEFIHALGFMHTHMRKDRDNHITINWARIETSQCSQFTKCDGCELDGPYETTSVMHYNSEGFACDPREKVVLRKDGGAIGYNHDTTPNDLNMIRNFYGC